MAFLKDKKKKVWIPVFKYGYRFKIRNFVYWVCMYICINEMRDIKKKNVLIEHGVPNSWIKNLEIVSQSSISNSLNIFFFIYYTYIIYYKFIFENCQLIIKTYFIKLDIQIYDYKNIKTYENIKSLSHIKNELMS